MRTKPANDPILPAGRLAEIAGAVAEMSVPRPFSMAGLIGRLSRSRDRPIRVLRGNLSGSMPTGMWLRTGTADYIVVARDVGAGHARHICLHELGHILLEDGDDAGDEDAELMAEEFAHRMAERIDASARCRTRESRAGAELDKAFAPAAELRGAHA
jgi:hypothetical protein